MLFFSYSNWDSTFQGLNQFLLGGNSPNGATLSSWTRPEPVPRWWQRGVIVISLTTHKITKIPAGHFHHHRSAPDNFTDAVYVFLLCVWSSSGFQSEGRYTSQQDAKWSRFGASLGAAWTLQLFLCVLAPAKKKNMLVDNCSLRLGRWEENAAMQRILFTASKDSFHTDCAP